MELWVRYKQPILGIAQEMYLAQTPLCVLRVKE